MLQGMDFFMLTGAFLFAFTMICLALWGLNEFRKHDYRASWYAYIAVLMPAFYLIAYGIIGSERHQDAASTQPRYVETEVKP